MFLIFLPMELTSMQRMRMSSWKCWSLFEIHRIALHESAHNGTVSIFKLLLDAGSDKDALDDVNRFDFTFLPEFIKFASF
jgi:hypothetical protein